MDNSGNLDPGTHHARGIFEGNKQTLSHGPSFPCWCGGRSLWLPSLVDPGSYRSGPVGVVHGPEGWFHSEEGGAQTNSAPF